jgi:hypothetical protein
MAYRKFVAIAFALLFVVCGMLSVAQSASVEALLSEINKLPAH